MAKALDRDEALAAFERFKKAIAEIAAVPKAAAKRAEPLPKKPTSKRKPR